MLILLPLPQRPGNSPRCLERESGALAAGGNHDAGKGTPSWQEYLVASAMGTKRLDKVPHAIHGASMPIGRPAVPGGRKTPWSYLANRHI